jgi:hypothetical protein
VLAAFESGDYVRTHTLRQTWHFVRRDDLPRVQAATAHRVHQRNALQYRQFGLDDDVRHRAATVILDALRAGPLPRPALAAHLASEGIDVSGMALGILMMWAELECLVASGPLHGKQHTYAVWSGPPTADRADAAVWLAAQFFGSHGPATLDDFTAWSSLSKTEARAALSDLPVRTVRVEGEECFATTAVSVVPWASPQVELLNGYDEYVSGLSAAGKRWLDPDRLYRDRRGTPVHVVFVDGRLAGHWRRAGTPSHIEVEVVALRPFSPTEVAALERASADYGIFVGVPATLSMRPPDDGP